MPSTPLYVKLPPEPVFLQNPGLDDQEGCCTASSPPPPKHTQPSPPNVPPPPIPPPPHPAALLRMVDFIPIKPDPNGNGTPPFSTSTPPPVGTDISINSLVEFPRENLKFIEKLGDGQFGEVRMGILDCKP